MRILSRAALIALALLACAVPAQAMAKGTGLEAYEVKATAKNLRTLGQQGFDVTEARHGSTIEIVATSKQAAGSRARASTRSSSATRGAAASRSARGEGNADGSYEDYRPYWDDTYVGTSTRRAARRARPSTRSCRRSPPRSPTSSSRSIIGHSRQRRADPRAQGHQGRAHDPRRPAPRGPVQRRPARPRVDHGRDEPPARAPVRRQLRRHRRPTRRRTSGDIGEAGA